MSDQARGGFVERRKRRIYVHSFQKRYALWLGLLIFVCSLLVFGFAFLAHYAAPVVKLASPTTLQEREIASQQFIALAETGGPAVVVLIIGAGLFSLYVTHRLAGPLYRLEQCARELAQGNMALRVKFRSGDELHELARVANEALANIDKALGEIRTCQASTSSALRRALERLQAHQQADEALQEEIEHALREGDNIDMVLKRFRLSDPS